MSQQMFKVTVVRFHSNANVLSSVVCLLHTGHPAIRHECSTQKSEVSKLTKKRAYYSSRKIIATSNDSETE